jgi:hypothetical protein
MSAWCSPKRPTGARHSSTIFSRIRFLARSASTTGSRSPAISESIIARRLGVVFGQRAAGGFGNAWAVGLIGAIDSDDLEPWPAAYRLGLIEGIMIDEWGNISLREQLVEPLIKILRPVPVADAKQALAELASLIPDAPWVVRASFTNPVPLPPVAILNDLRSRTGELQPTMVSSFEELLTALGHAIPHDPA